MPINRDDAGTNPVAGRLAVGTQGGTGSSGEGDSGRRAKCEVRYERGRAIGLGPVYIDIRIPLTSVDRFRITEL